MMRVIADLALDVGLHREMPHHLRAVASEHRIKVGFGRSRENILGEELAADFDAYAIRGAHQVHTGSGSRLHAEGRRPRTDQHEKGYPGGSHNYDHYDRKHARSQPETRMIEKVPAGPIANDTGHVTAGAPPG